MLDHVTIRATDREASRRFYTSVLGAPTYVPTDEAVAEFHRRATGAGYRDNGGPGERPQYHAGYVGAFVLDPDGNNVEAVNHNR